MADSFILFADYADTIRGMSDIAAGILVKMIFNHVTGADELEGVTTEEGSDILDDASFAAARVAAGFIARQIDRSAKVYEELREKRREAGAKGAEKRWQSHSKAIANDGNAIASDSKPKQTIANDGKGCLPNPNPIPNPIDSKRGRFTPPTLDDVKAYCAERKSPVDPVRFFEYFEAGCWKDSKGTPVRNWKQKLITWEKHAEVQPQRKQNMFLQIENHEYDFEALEKELMAN